MLTASCSLSEFDFARSGGSLEKQRKGQKPSDSRVKDNTLNDFVRLKSHPGMPGPEATVCTGGSGVRFSTLVAGEGAGEGAAESLELEQTLARSDPESLENFT